MERKLLEEVNALNRKPVEGLNIKELRLDMIHPKTKAKAEEKRYEWRTREEKDDKSLTGERGEGHECGQRQGIGNITECRERAKLTEWRKKMKQTGWKGNGISCLGWNGPDEVKMGRVKPD
ncbi:hypothetical protein ATANTOWER_009802 [Ataeniobius toweri]|uniref:Uncharacterized protein n=1 Tax=Ataeniobius toweri TaxID=208326 RepID=A0ABU7A6P3_9TELE|nr:hypothetical protein [Ataeniobius toweri]